MCLFLYILSCQHVFAARVTDVMFLQSNGHDYVMCVHEYVRLQSGYEDVNTQMEGYNSQIKHIPSWQWLDKLFLFYRVKQNRGQLRQTNFDILGDAI